ncbi:pyruvate/2-oxoglutarate/acetoin dehydrogenase E1 component/TPP-dependent pyruvate/acetoin dehydrogenase alpha subunit [Wenyingzhuangia heitensis]|uniref:3-methyl-2-oxobutanoate dehydrogenase (2-methylpropanoyl-transferring) n=1 Tax=Wenyingzhuangia heitensis TaxID=1487859 RepID=A0ABX0UBX5_9FLAO|nr:alpha-ketoacid dehydrogenase subunit alpha/beta [Wenyingzhuangia heitensis]NIJ44567.1 pyruvate/2-oxoglutarate/acetoin dehydrogenase E1 component/TPP-dependent pyruvate/acetoin dehydrogenase alpha subunit [Wenyingzhuangia heitensis]
MPITIDSKKEQELTFNQFKEEILNDYYIAVLSRECSLLGRKEVLTGKAKFGIFGDGKELPQIAMAKAFEKGDWRSGYYRDQTFMLALGELTPQQFFAGLYAHTDIKHEPFAAGRQMGGHFASHSLDENGDWKNLTEQYNTASDVSCTAAQMPRLVGLAYASKLYRQEKTVQTGYEKFSKKGNEVAWGTIGNASTSEGHFFEAINAAGVLQIPMVASIWDDEYGISVHQKHHTTKENISEVLKGFQRDDNTKGIEIFNVKGWDYSSLIEAYTKASQIAREEHVPVMIHVDEVTQPQGHSTSGSHERYKSAERLQWEKDFDCIKKMREWILDFDLSEDDSDLRLVKSEDELIAIEKKARQEVSAAKRIAWQAFIKPLKEEQQTLLTILNKVADESTNKNFVLKFKNDLEDLAEVHRKDIFGAARKILSYIREENIPSKALLQNWMHKNLPIAQEKYSSKLLNDFGKGASSITEKLPTYADTKEIVDARIIIRDNFDALLKKHDNLFIFGEDAGKIGDVNQGLESLQDKYGELRVADTGIREATIMGQGIGMALRGLRPIAEIQYLDYILYAVQTLSDDLACLRYRTYGKQTAPLIVRTRGHRLEGIWHSGSPMALILSCLRGMHLLVPRNMTKAAGFYNSLLQTDEPAIVIENLNGYRLKEEKPNNLGEFLTPIGYSETIKEGTDITLVSYGSTLKIVMEVAQRELAQVGINAEVIDVQSLMPFDLDHNISYSVSKTNRLAIIDEDVPGGASAYILQKVVDEQNAYQHLDSKPICISAQEHRPAYGSDGDYFSKPSHDDVFEKVYAVFHEANPSKFPKLY